MLWITTYLSSRSNRRSKKIIYFCKDTTRHKIVWNTSNFKVKCNVEQQRWCYLNKRHFSWNSVFDFIRSFIYNNECNSAWSIVLTTGHVTHGNYIVRTVQQMRFHVFLRQNMHGIVWARVQWWTGVAFFTLDNVQWHSVTNYAMMSVERTFHILLHDLVFCLMKDHWKSVNWI